MNIFLITANLICGICLGLYLNDIALLIILLYGFIVVFLGYKNKKVFIVGFLIFLIFYFSSYNSQKKYEDLFNDGDSVSGILKVISFKDEKKYKNKYIVEYEKNKFILYVDKKEEYNYGDILQFEGNFEKASSSKNFGGFDYSRYLRQQKIFGNLNIENARKIGKEKDFKYYLENIKLKLKQNLFNTFNKEQSGFLIGLLLGDKTEVLDETANDFRNSNLSHILALSGLHIIYVSYAIRFLLNLITPKQRLKNFLMILFLIFFSIFTGGSPSCIRACIMSSMVLLSKVLYRKNDFITSFLVSLDIILIINCYNIESIGMWLVYISFYKGDYTQKPDFKAKLKNKIISIFQTGISCNLMIIPIIWNSYNTFSLTFLISNFFSSFLIGPIIILGYVNLFLCKLFFPFIESFLLNILFKIAEIVGNLSFSKIYVPSIPIIIWIFYYILIFAVIVFLKNKYIFKKLILYLKYKIKYIIYIGIFLRNNIYICFLQKTKLRNSFFRCRSRGLFFNCYS